jgi:hypothetical protein
MVLHQAVSSWIWRTDNLGFGHGRCPSILERQTYSFNSRTANETTIIQEPLRYFPMQTAQNVNFFPFSLSRRQIFATFLRLFGSFLKLFEIFRESKWEKVHILRTHVAQYLPMPENYRLIIIRSSLSGETTLFRHPEESMGISYRWGKGCKGTGTAGSRGQGAELFEPSETITINARTSSILVSWLSPNRYVPHIVNRPLHVYQMHS